MLVSFKYNKDKFQQRLQEPVEQNIDSVNGSLKTLQNYNGNEQDWINSMRNVSARLSVLKESYKMIGSYRKKAGKVDFMARSSLTDEDEGSSDTTSTPSRRSRHGRHERYAQ